MRVSSILEPLLTPCLLILISRMHARFRKQHALALTGADNKRSETCIVRAYRMGASCNEYRLGADSEEKSVAKTVAVRYCVLVIRT